jgi:hypothetical protein
MPSKRSCKVFPISQTRWRRVLTHSPLFLTPSTHSIITMSFLGLRKWPTPVSIHSNKSTNETPGWIYCFCVIDRSPSLAFHGCWCYHLWPRCQDPGRCCQLYVPFYMFNFSGSLN